MDPGSPATQGLGVSGAKLKMIFYFMSDHSAYLRFSIMNLVCSLFVHFHYIYTKTKYFRFRQYDEV